MHTLPVEELVSIIKQVNQTVKTEFSPLKTEQINAKPGPGEWSIAQCLDHIIVTNKAYFQQIEMVLKGEKKKTFFEMIPFLSELWAKILIKAVSPETTRKMKTFRVFDPSAEIFPDTLINNFIENNCKLIELMNKIYELNAEKTVITSPVSPVITYSLKNTFCILTLHEERHINQAIAAKKAL